MIYNLGEKEEVFWKIQVLAGFTCCYYLTSRQQTYIDPKRGVGRIAIQEIHDWLAPFIVDGRAKITEDYRDKLVVLFKDVELLTLFKLSTRSD